MFISRVLLKIAEIHKAPSSLGQSNLSYSASSVSPERPCSSLWLSSSDTWSDLSGVGDEKQPAGCFPQASLCQLWSVSLGTALSTAPWIQNPPLGFSYAHCNQSRDVRPSSWHRHSHDSSPVKWLWDFPQSLRSNKPHSVQSQLCGGPCHQWKKSEQAWLAGAEPTGMPACLAEGAGSRSVPESLQQYFSSFHICSTLDVTWCVCVWPQPGSRNKVQCASPCFWFFHLTM